MKDNFSGDSENYALYRPTYPVGLFQYLISLLAHRNNAWDCATGNGQVAYQLTGYFGKIYGSDISQNQLLNARRHHKIHYSRQPAEHTDFPDNHFDLVTVAQAIHWFDFEKFYPEVQRVLTKDGLLAVIGYGLLSVSASIDRILSRLYWQTLGSYWDPERKYIDEEYNSIPFPFQELETPKFEIQLDWTLHQLTGYLNTWSAVKHFENQNGFNPVEETKEALKQFWPSEELRTIRFAVLLRVGRLKR